MKLNFNYTFFGLDLLIKGSIFIWLYRALGITQLVSFPALFLAVGIEVGVLIVMAIIAGITAVNAKKLSEKTVQDFFETYDPDGYEYYD